MRGGGNRTGVRKKFFGKYGGFLLTGQSEYARMGVSPTRAERKGQEMDIKTIAEVIVMTNDQRLDGTITREQHAIMIRQFDDLLAKSGYTWDDVAAAAK